MRPKDVGLIVGVLMCFTLPCYYYMIPDTLVDSTESKGKEGYWGRPDAEFDWCELNYMTTPYIAEPFNTFTSILYLGSAVMGLVLHQSLPSGGLRFVELLMLFFVALIGVGSTAFHATLLYPMQLLDELPIYWLMLSCSHALFHREDTAGKISGKASALILCGIGGGLSAVLVTTAQISPVHNVARGLMSTTFAMAFIYIFYSASIASHETAQRLESIGGHPDSQSPVRNFTTAFLLFVGAIVSWLLDNFCCPTLQQLPFGIPYPHLHALGWHLGTATGLHLMFTNIVFHNQVAQHVAAGSGAATVELGFCYGVVPFIAYRKK
jgi:dihydroceramidase